MSYKLLVDKKKSGFTLIEVITALVILTAGVLSLVALLTVGLASFGSSQDITIASLKGQQKLEELKRNGINSLPNPPPLPGRGAFSTPTAFPSPEERFSWSMAVSYVDDGSLTDTAIDGLREVIVRITWSRFGRGHSEDFTTYVSRH